MLLISLMRTLVAIIMLAAILTLTQGMTEFVVGIAAFFGLWGYFFVTMILEDLIVKYFNPEEDDEQR